MTGWVLWSNNDLPWRLMALGWQPPGNRQRVRSLPRCGVINSLCLAPGCMCITETFGPSFFGPSLAWCLRRGARFWMSWGGGRGRAEQDGTRRDTLLVTLGGGGGACLYVPRRCALTNVMLFGAWMIVVTAKRGNNTWLLDNVCIVSSNLRKRPFCLAEVCSFWKKQPRGLRTNCIYNFLRLQFKASSKSFCYSKNKKNETKPPTHYWFNVAKQAWGYEV